MVSDESLIGHRQTASYLQPRRPPHTAFWLSLQLSQSTGRQLRVGTVPREFLKRLRCCSFGHRYPGRSVQSRHTPPLCSSHRDHTQRQPSREGHTPIRPQSESRAHVVTSPLARHVHNDASECVCCLEQVTSCPLLPEPVPVSWIDFVVRVWWNEFRMTWSAVTTR